MTFNENAKLDTSGVQKRGRGAKTAAIGGGSIGLLIVAFLASQFLGVDLTGLVSGMDQGQQTQQQEVEGGGLAEQCQTGADANQQIDCRMVGVQNSLADYWETESAAVGVTYEQPGFILYEGQTSSACGTESNAVGPFYCPGDSSMYVDTSFFQLLTSQLGAKEGPLAEMYVVAHEWGHHIQHQMGVFDNTNRTDTGPTSDGVGIELQADCFAGAWLGEAANTQTDEGVTLLDPPTREQVNVALSAASAVGDDHIQGQQGQVNPESFTHGTSEQRVNWFVTGYEKGTQSCDTFAVSGNEL